MSDEQPEEGGATGRAIERAKPRPIQPITTAQDVAAIREQWVTSKHQELERARTALDALQAAGASEQRLAAVKARVRLLAKVVGALEAGYIPLPRFDSTRFTIDLQELPIQAIVALAAAQRSQLFDEVRFVHGQQSDSYRGARGRRAQRDPLLVGVIRTPGRRVDRGGGWYTNEPGLEEHFLVAWWRPEDETDEVMF